MSAHGHAGQPSRGFQGSETHGVNVVIYPHKREAIFAGNRTAPDRFVLEGRTGRDGNLSPAVVSLQTSKTMAEGTFTFVVKEPLNVSAFSIADVVTDDDWVDIEFVQNGRRFHTMRGIIEGINFSETTSGSGATVRTTTITGKDHTAIFAKTQVWVNRFVGEITDVTLAEILDATGSFTPTPDEAVVKLLQGLLRVQTESQRTAFKMPSGIPDRSDDLLNRIRFVTDGFDPKPARRTASIMLADPTRSGLWSFVSEFSDPLFCELYADLVPKLPDGVAAARPYLDPTGEAPIGSTEMGVIFRTRPFQREQAPDVDDPSTDTKAWERLPTALCVPQDFTALNLGRSGAERYNAFYASTDLTTADQKTLVPPLWDQDDVYKHGVREFTISSRYFPENGTDVLLLSELRWIAACWHCLNPYLLSGTGTLGRLRPDVRVGMRLRVQDENIDKQRTFYVEQVAHAWSLGSPRTTIGLTRGWTGSDESYRKALAQRLAAFGPMPGTGGTV